MTQERVTLESFRAALGGAVRKVQDDQYIYGRLGRQEEDGTYTVEVPKRPRYLYVLVDGEQSPSIAYNEGVNPTGNDGIPIRMLMIRGVLTIVGINVEELHAYKRGDPYYPAEVAGAQVAQVIDDATAKTMPVDADTVGLVDSADSNALKKLSWANIKATLRTAFDSVYFVLAGKSGGQTAYGGTGSGDDLKLGSTSHATKGDVRVLDWLAVGGDFAPTEPHHIQGSHALNPIQRVENTSGGTAHAKTEYESGTHEVEVGFGMGALGGPSGILGTLSATNLTLLTNGVVRWWIGSSGGIIHDDSTLFRDDVESTSALWGINATPVTDAQMLIESGAAMRNALRLRAAASQSVPVLDITDNSGTPIFQLLATGLIDAFAGARMQGEQIRALSRFTDGAVSISTSSTTLLNLGGDRSHIVLVYGYNGGSQRFIDLISVITYGSTSTIFSHTLGGPPGRNYSVSARVLSLAMVSGTFDVQAAQLLNIADP